MSENSDVHGSEPRYYELDLDALGLNQLNVTENLAGWLLTQIQADEDFARTESEEDPPLAWAVFRLAECDAKRRIIAEHSVVYVPPPGSPYPVNDSCPVCDQLPCLTLRLLALPFADRPGYREEWKP